MLVKFRNLHGALKQAYPEKEWDESKFSTKRKKSAQRCARLLRREWRGRRGRGLNEAVSGFSDV
jgi:hypothetical protein